MWEKCGKNVQRDLGTSWEEEIKILASFYLKFNAITFLLLNWLCPTKDPLTAKDLQEKVSGGKGKPDWPPRLNSGASPEVSMACGWQWKRIPTAEEHVRHNCWHFIVKLQNSNLVYLLSTSGGSGSGIQTSNVFPADDLEIPHRATPALKCTIWQERTPGSQKASICFWPCLILSSL